MVNNFCVLVISWLMRFRYFNRDVQCIRTFFKRRFRYESSLFPVFKTTLKGENSEGFRLDVAVEASGFGRRDMKVLEQVTLIIPRILSRN